MSQRIPLPSLAQTRDTILLAVGSVGLVFAALVAVAIVNPFVAIALWWAITE